MDTNELKEILEKHKAWANGRENGERADLRGADLHEINLCDAILKGADLRNAGLHGVNLSGASLYYADLRGADLRGANLRGANLCGASLCGANLHGAHLCGVNLYHANLCYANLCDANLRGASLRCANFSNADLSGVDLSETDLHDANLCNTKNIPFIPMVCPDSGLFIAWKKANGYIVKLLVPEDARRSSATGRKCRCDKAIVVAIETKNGEPAEVNEVASYYDKTFIYRVGETVIEPNFCEDRFKECAEGIHFFVNRQEAVDY